MGIFFSKKKTKADPISERDRAILELKRQRDRLHKFSLRLNEIVARETDIAKQLILQGKRDRALLALKKKKYQQQTLDKTEGQLMNLEEMVHSIEFASMQAQVFSALSQGKDVLEKLNSQMSIEDVEKLMEDSQEAIEYQNRISELLGSALSDADEEEVERELALIEEQEMEEEVKQMPVADKPITEPIEAASGDRVNESVQADDSAIQDEPESQRSQPKPVQAKTQKKEKVLVEA